MMIVILREMELGRDIEGDYEVLIRKIIAIELDKAAIATDSSGTKSVYGANLEKLEELTSGFETLPNYLKEIGYVNDDLTVNAGGYRITDSRWSNHRRRIYDWLNHIGVRGEKVTKSSMESFYESKGWEPIGGVSISDILNELHTKEYITTYGTVISKNLIEDKVKSDFKALYERNGFSSTESESKAQEIYDILKLSASEVFNKEGSKESSFMGASVMGVNIGESLGQVLNEYENHANNLLCKLVRISDTKLRT